MVGPPKTLEDLRRVEGAVRVTCTACGHIELRDREEMIQLRRAYRRSCEWAAILTDQRCGKCSSEAVKVDGVPFGENMAELRQRRARMLLMNLALQVLTDAARRAGREDVDTPAVRLALRVLHAYVGDAAMLTTFWKEVERTDRRPWNGAHQALRWITQRLLDRGYPVWAELR